MLVMSPDTLRRLTNCRLLLVLLLLTVHRLEFPTLVLKTHYTASQINNSKRAVMLYSVYRSRRIRSLSIGWLTVPCRPTVLQTKVEIDTIRYDRRV